MYSLNIIKKLNGAPLPKHESETTRHCSFAGSVSSGVVLHSAKKRSTVFLSAGKRSERFLVNWFSSNSATKHDALVESYF